MACDTIKIETLDADEVVSIVTQGPQGPSGAEAATLTTTGDLLYRAALANDRLPIGTEGQVLKVSSGLPAWGNESGAVTSVNGETGTVVLDAADVGAAPATGIDPTAITGTAVVDNDARLSDTRDPNAHANSHAAAGSDPLAPSDIGAQSIFTTANASAPTGAALQMTAQRARIWTVTNTAITGDADIQLPLTGIVAGDVAVIRGNDSSTANLTVKSPAQSGGTVLFYTNPQNTPSGNPVVISNASHQYRFIVNDPTSFVPWSFVAVDSHTHAATDITSGTLDIARVPTGTTSTTVALGNHTHELDDLDATAITAGKILTADGDNTASWQDAPAGGDTVSIEASAADVLSVSSGAISAVDATADRIVFWDDSASKLAYLEAGSGLSISGTTLTATASGTPTQTDVFTANGTYTKPAGAKIIRAVLVGGGGGAGAGRRGAAGTVRAGGGGGGGAAVVAFVTDAAYFGATESITVGSGGNGGANSADDTNGANGSDGGNSSIGSLVTAIGGKAGGGGSTAGGAAGAATGSSVWFYGTSTTSTNGGGGGSTGNAGGGGASTIAPTGGGGGGGINDANNAVAGGQSGNFGSSSYGLYNAQSTNPPTVQNGKDIPYAVFGTGGAGTRAIQSGSVGNQGGNGARGGGGGGGSGALNGAGGSTAGGSGGNGIVVITTYF